MIGHTRLRPRCVAAVLAAAAAVLPPGPARAQCPVGKVIAIDKDIPGSGYSETSNNWATWSTAPCSPPGYRYLSKTVGDGSRKGKAIFEPAIKHAGTYAVRTGFRPTENRTDDADYYVYDDTGAVLHKSVNQQLGSGCVFVDLGNHYCVPGGKCRVVLDGDDGKSDEADITEYELLSCDSEPPPPPPPPAGPCAGIEVNPAYELCAETASTCAGVFTDGSGCIAYCAAAGMLCVARFGGEPGCSKEPQNVLKCGDSNGHDSDWCECESKAAPVAPDSGGQPGVPDAGPPVVEPDAGAPPPEPDAGGPVADAPVGSADGATARADARAAAPDPGGPSAAGDEARAPGIPLQKPDSVGGAPPVAPAAGAGEGGCAAPGWLGSRTGLSLAVASLLLLLFLFGPMRRRTP